MNAFANPEEAFPYEFQEFPKPEDQVTEYANVEGAVGYQLRGFDEARTVYQGSDSTPVVQPAILQDFKEVFAATQS